MTILTDLISLIKIFTSEISIGQRAYILGKVTAWVIHAALIYFSFKFGHRLYNRKKSKNTDNKSKAD